MKSLMRTPTLLLNGCYTPLRIITARRALTLVCKGAAVVEVPTNTEVYLGIMLPSVVRLRSYKRIPVRMQVVTRRNIVLRDANRCQYCGKHFPTSELTLDHIIPKSRGGKASWDNLVSACSWCNRMKDNRTPEEAGMPLLHRPIPSSIHTPRHLLRTMAGEVEEWKRFIFHDNEGDRRYGAFVN